MRVDGILGATSTHVLLMNPTLTMTAHTAEQRTAASRVQAGVLGGDRAFIPCTDGVPAARVASS